MEGKLRQLMKHEGINSTRLAEILGIQASGISHIMSGRNKPSFDFLLKLLQRFPQINPDWLLLDKGPMYRDEIKNKSGRSVPTGHNAPIDGGAHGVPGSSVGSGGQAGSGSQVGSGGSVSQVGSGSQVGPGGSVAGGQRGLFGPDNNDIIPTGGDHKGGRPGSGSYPGPGSPVSGSHLGSAGGPSGPGGHTTDSSGGYSGGYQEPNAYSSGAAAHSEHMAHLTHLQAMQHPVHKTGELTRSALIERIVVFYKDKTFSEYQPE